MAGKKHDDKTSKRGPKKGAEPDPFFRPFSNLPKPEREKPSVPATGKSPAAQPLRVAPPAPPKAPKPTAQPSESDELLTFERLMAGVTPLEKAPARRVPAFGPSAPDSRIGEIQQHRAREGQLEEQARAKFKALVEEGSNFEIRDDGRSIDGRRRGVDGGLVRRMKAGEILVDATLDLHGMRVDQARDAVDDFIRTRRTRGDRVVVIVHGKGRHSPSGQAVLRGEAAAWLSEGKSSKHVSAFVTACADQGGEGALCVLLVGPDDRPSRV